MKTLRKLFMCLVLSLIVAAAAAPVAAQGFKWWQTERFQKELALTPEQITRIEGIYQTTEPLLRARRARASTGRPGGDCMPHGALPRARASRAAGLRACCL